MPTDLVGVAFYLLLIIPGVVFSISRERHRPKVKRSAFRETATAVFVSATIFALFALAVALMSMVDVTMRSEVTAFLKDPTSYTRAHFDWFVIVSTAALGVAGVASWLAGGKKAHELTFGRWQDDPDRESWGYVFNRFPEALNFAGVQLKDGTWVEGYVDTYGNVGEEGEPKALTLLGNISVRPPGGELQPFSAETIVLKDDEITYLSVSYVADADSDSDSSPARPRVRLRLGVGAMVVGLLALGFVVGVRSAGG
ncbi:DUF6338 family protein [Microbacterium sp. NPDC055665]